MIVPECVTQLEERILLGVGKPSCSKKYAPYKLDYKIIS